MFGGLVSEPTWLVPGLFGVSPRKLEQFTPGHLEGDRDGVSESDGMKSFGREPGDDS